MPANFTFDAHEVLDSFKKLTGKEMDKAVRNTLQQSANILVKEARTQLSKVTKASNHPNSWNGKKLRDGIRRSKFNKQLEEVKVHILGDYRLRWFELGTKDRYAKTYKGKPLKKPRFLGHYKASHFFKTAQVIAEPKVFNEIEARMAKNIMKIANK